MRAGWQLIVAVALLLGACAGPPQNPADVCAIFREKPGWYRDTVASFEKWGVPVHVQMAIMRQESAFRSLARPPRKMLWGFIPTTWLSSAYGYAQVKNETWDWYRRQSGNGDADRDDFGDAVDFIGWYGRLSQEQLGISKWDAYRQYLAYHEGHGGYRRRSYRDKAWLQQAAQRVANTARRYRAQLAACRGELERSPWYWPFNIRGDE
ncbi:MAG: transglycosylase SLT domain-containing protein [Gammaproteobacteria bacterium]